MLERRKLVVFGVGTGLGIVIAAAIAIGLWSYLTHREKPWNKTAITAEYDGLRAEGAEHDLAFRYTLTNSTDRDFRIDDASSIQFAGRLKDQNSLLFTNSRDSERLDFPIFVPEHSRVRLTVHTRYRYTSADPEEGSKDERHDWETLVTQFATKEFPNLGGFVILDSTKRYEIDLPTGWEKRSREPLRIQAGHGVSTNFSSK